MVGTVHAIFTCVFVLIAILVVIDEPLAISLSYLAMVIGVALYPTSGFLADVIFGRYRMIVTSVCCIVVSFIFIFGAIIDLFETSHTFFFTATYYSYACNFGYFILFDFWNWCGGLPCKFHSLRS